MLANGQMGRIYPRLRLYQRLKAAFLTTVIVVFFPIIGTALYISTGFIWLREHFGPRSLRFDGFLFASAYAALATAAACELFKGHLLPRFNDIYLLGIVLTAYRFTWRSAAYLLALALALSAWAQPPVSDRYGMISFAAVSVCSIAVMARLKTVPARVRQEAGQAYTFLPLAGPSR